MPVERFSEGADFFLLGLDDIGERKRLEAARLVQSFAVSTVVT